MIWSPDGRSVAFAGDKLKRIDLPDGTPVTLSDVPNVRVIGRVRRTSSFFRGARRIYRVPASGGAAVVERAGRAAEGVRDYLPWLA